MSLVRPLTRGLTRPLFRSLVGRGGDVLSLLGLSPTYLFLAGTDTLYEAYDDTAEASDSVYGVFNGVASLESLGYNTTFAAISAASSAGGSGGTVEDKQFYNDTSFNTPPTENWLYLPTTGDTLTIVVKVGQGITLNFAELEAPHSTIGSVTFEDLDILAIEFTFSGGSWSLDRSYNVFGVEGGFYQELIDKRPTANADGSISFDGVDDFLDVAAFPKSGTFEGTMVCGTSNGTFAFDVSYSAGDLTQIDLLGQVNGQYQSGSLFAFGLFPKLTDEQIDFVRSEFVALGASDGATFTNLSNYFRNRNDLINFKYFDVAGVDSLYFFLANCSNLQTADVGAWDTSSVTYMRLVFYNCPSLTTLDVSSWNTSSVTNFGFFATNCSSLTALDVSNWNTSSVTTFERFANACSSLTALDVSNWNTSSVTTFERFAFGCTSLTELTIQGGTGDPFADSPCTDYTNAFVNTNLNQTSIDNLLIAIEAAGTSNGTFDQSGGSAPSASGEAAILSLRGRGWTVTVTGGY